MENYKISQNELNEVKELVDKGAYSEIMEKHPYGFGINSNRLDHVEMGATYVIFHDRGNDFGNGVIDLTFCLTSR